MPRERKSPRVKKDLSLERDHFTFAKNQKSFRKTWRKKKANANRQYRRKSDELLAPAKTELNAEAVDAIIGDLTANQLQHSVSRKRLHKSDTVNVGEKVRFKLEKRKETAGRRVNEQRRYDSTVRDALTILVRLNGKQLVRAVDRIASILHRGNAVAWSGLKHSHDPLDHAILAFGEIYRGNAYYRDALARNSDLCELFKSWTTKLLRTLDKLQRPPQEKLAGKIANKKKIRESLRKKTS